MELPHPAPEPHADPALKRVVDRIRAARASGTPLRLRGGGTKDFYGAALHGEVLDLRGLAGISSYEPSELVVTARAGTPLAELEAELAAKDQCLPFEPPRFGPGGTVGGMVAAGLSGPARASVGCVRDYVLGASLINGDGDVLGFGGRVMKNVAGYDVSRLLAGSLGTLGVIAEVSLKVLPVSPATATLRFAMAQEEALGRLHAWGGRPLPLNASAWWDGALLLRLRGALAAVRSAIVTLGGDVVEPVHAGPFWNGLRDHADEYFQTAHAAVAGGGAALWRLSLPQTAAPLALPGEQLIEWHGGQRWLCTPAPAVAVREAAAQAGGHATLFRAGPKGAHALETGVFAPLAPPIERIHRRLKQSFDPAGLFNPGRLYPGL